MSKEMMARDVLFELGVEELPSAAVKLLSNALKAKFEQVLVEARLPFKNIKAYGAPRRLAVIIESLEAMQPEQTIEKLGPKEQAGFDGAGKPTKALEGFARSCGVDVDALKVIETDKGPRFSYQAVLKGQKTETLLPELAAKVSSSLPIAKAMRWGDSDTTFVRPVHWLVFLWGQDVVDASLFDCKATRKTYGHRYHHPGAVSIKQPSEYEQALEQAYVIADFIKRRTQTKAKILKLAAKVGEVILPDDLLDEVTSIIEWPVPLMVDFDKAFLQVPAEVLIASMQEHQKCFVLKDSKDKLLPHFITVSNIKSQQQASVVHGNARVMHARLSDAQFFYAEDKKTSLADRVKATEHVVFQKDLGSLREKTLRLEKMAAKLAPKFDIDTKLAKRAASISKSDLLTGMVFEFPELQGTMGKYYALADGEDKAVASAIEEQYLPRFSKDDLPKSNLGLMLSLIDRVDTLVGIFSVGLKPTGEKDPFKLRRHALAIIRILNASPLSLELTELLKLVPLQVDTKLIEEVKAFILERLPAYYQAENYPVEWIRAATAKSSECLKDLNQRLLALHHFMQQSEAQALAQASKRVSKILAQQKITGGKAEEAQLVEPEEKALFTQLNRVQANVALQYEEHAYGPILTELAKLKPVTEAFFDKVMVLDKDAKLRKNRLHLLFKLQNLLQCVVDVSLLPQG